MDVSCYYWREREERHGGKCRAVKQADQWPQWICRWYHPSLLSASWQMVPNIRKSPGDPDKGGGVGIRVSTYSIFARESLFNLLFTVLWVFSQLCQVFAFWELLCVTPGWRYCCINQTDWLAVSFYCLSHVKILYPLGHFHIFQRENPKSEGRDPSLVTKLVAAGLPEKIQDVQLNKGEFQINRNVSYYKSIPNMTWDIFTLKTYLLFIWNSDLTGLAVKYIYLLSLATLGRVN